jgi:hypothetical protein
MIALKLTRNHELMNLDALRLCKSRMREESSIDGRMVILQPILLEIEVTHDLSVDLSRTISRIIPR